MRDIAMLDIGNMIRIPGVKGKNGATTAQLISEQISLCESNLENIERIAFYNKKREIRNEINRRIRNCHNLLGMSGDRRSGCLYREVRSNSSKSLVCEHAIPVSALVSLYESGVPLKEVVFYPVACISKESDKRFQELRLVKSGHDLEIPFMRYHRASIELETHCGEKIDCASWSISDHWHLVESTTEISKIREEVLQEKPGMVPQPT